MLKFMDVFGRWEGLELSQLEAAELLGMGERTFRRWCRRCEEECEAGLLDRRIGKASGKRVPVDRCEEVEALYRTRDQGFTLRHFHEHLVWEHRFAWSYSWTKTFLQSRNLLTKARRAPAQAATSSVAGDDAASRCVAARVAAAGTAARSGGDDGRCNE
jgi:transposase